MIVVGKWASLYAAHRSMGPCETRVECSLTLPPPLVGTCLLGLSGLSSDCLGLGCLFGSPGALLAPCWPPVGLSESLVGLSWAPWGASWASLGISWASLFGPLKPRADSIATRCPKIRSRSAQVTRKGAKITSPKLYFSCFF